MQYSPILHGRLIFILMCSKWLVYSKDVALQNIF
jgi:hypothetical protein